MSGVATCQFDTGQSSSRDGHGTDLGSSYPTCKTHVLGIVLPNISILQTGSVFLIGPEVFPKGATGSNGSAGPTGPTGPTGGGGGNSAAGTSPVGIQYFVTGRDAAATWFNPAGSESGAIFSLTLSVVAPPGM